MTFLDMKTIIFSYILSNFICTIVMMILWKQNRNYFRGTGFWLINFSFHTLGFIMIALRGKIPDLLSMGLSNILSMTGVLLSVIGLERFAGIKNRHHFNFVLLFAFSIIQIWFSVFEPSLPVRNVNISVAGIVFCMQGAWVTMFKVDKNIRKLTFRVGMIFIVFALISIFRITEIVFNPLQSNDFFNSGILNPLVILSFQMLFILLTYCLVLMFNGKLMMEISSKEEELLKKIEALEKFNRVTVDRELKMIELKKEINELLKQSGRKEKYTIAGKPDEK